MTLLIAAVKIPVSANDSNVRYLAQTPQLPNSPLPDRRQDREIEPLPPIDDFLESPERSPGSESPETAIEFTIQEFKLEGNTVLDPAEIELVIQEYRDRPITFADLLELETELTRLYTENGYINSAVVIPAQNVSQGVITIQAVEGTVAEINVTVDGRLKEGYVRSRLQRGIGKVLNVNQLQEALQLLQLNPLIENLNAELSVGLSRDRWMLDVDVNQGQAFDPVLFANNYRTPAVGSFQRGLELNHNNVLGYADRFSFIYKNTDGSNDFDTSYTIPVNSLDGTVGLRYRYVDSEIIESEFDSLNLESETSEFELTLRQPLLLEANAESTQEFALGLEFSRQSNSTTVDLEGDSQGRIPLDLVANPTGRDGGDIGETNVSALRFFQDWTRRSRTDVIALRSQVSVGLNIFDATVLDDAPDGEFVAWRGQVQWLRQLATSSNINLLLRSDIQLSSDDLVPLERFSLGGVESVRGYRQDALLGDSGIFASAEVRIPFYRWNNNQSNLSVAPFFDVGSNWSNSDESDRDDDTLASLGVGLQLNLDDSLRARIDYGIPLIDIENDDHTLQENGLYLSLDYFPF
ncbi:MAG: ShlB/FhaC/HecB family hemolysin secretion/activation protein [Cyanobacteria bacterium P01_G01_bin.19]